MRQDYTLLALVLDKSGSMQVVRDLTISGVNEFMKDQQKLPGECDVVLTLFDTQLYRKSLHRLQDWPGLGSEKLPYEPGGNTALWDATASTIGAVGSLLEALPEEERPSRVMFVVQTDGQENSSRQYTARQVREMVEHQQEKYNWAFLFLGADQDAWLQGEAMGIQGTLSYASEQTGAVYAAAAADVMAYRLTGNAPTTRRDLRTEKKGKKLP